MQALATIAILMAVGTAAAAPRDYAAGQVWRYRTRPQDVGSLLKIGAVEDGGALGPIYHISVVKVRLGRSPDPMPIGHLPVSKQTLDASVVAPVHDAEAFPDVAEGVAEWRRAKGGVFTIPMAEIVEIVDSQVRGAGG